MAASEDFDVVVVGGGPSGSTVSTLVAKQGHRVLLLEKETFPRYQIGESLLPGTVHGLASLLGVAEEIRAAGFVRKRGGVFRWGSSPEPWSFSFDETPDMFPYAYQVERAKFDTILLDNAARSGVTVRQRATASEVVREGERVVGLRYRHEGREREARARYVVDASGNGSRLHRQAGGERVYSQFFRNLAVFGYFEGGKRLPEPNSGSIFCVAFEDGWFWYIPLSETLTSVGAVVHRSKAAEIQASPVQALATFVDRCPLIKDYLQGAERVTEGIYGTVRVRKDYSYCGTRFWAPGIVLTGDAACFIDPVFSSGVHLATYSGLLAARSINSCLGGGLDENRSFGEFEARYRREYGVFYEFLMAFYDVGQTKESYFWQARRAASCELNELQSFVRLVGGSSSGETSFMDPTAVGERVRSIATAWREEGEYSTRPPRQRQRTTPTEDHILNRMWEQERVIEGFASTAATRAETAPLIPGGLVATADGLHWAEPAPAATPAG
ncbi:tryptophan 7-halogenase [Allostreptomyces psammosilenae]|uniref:Halogenation protein CepH n=1 Tax=Allostreptomyces psammosilenae TaxID=1892865 RepID=A0A852ZUF1_9ACTN|nr:tryptophan 7-halogenase [Allostreptomyces psammosilenae]NYI06023.1 halogenation protein CepH [Allostreptomyces psammosilenae]